MSEPIESEFVDTGETLVIDITLESPLVSINQKHGVGCSKAGRAKIFNSREARAEEEEVFYKIRSYLAKNKINVDDLLWGIRAYKLNMQICKRKENWICKNGNLKKSDLTNIIKPLEDCVIKALNGDNNFIDDSQCVELTLSKAVDNSLDDAASRLLMNFIIYK
jgi:Holliday junction resolvase RusA-like endonuclease